MPKKVWEFFEATLEGYIFPVAFGEDDESGEHETTRCPTCHKSVMSHTCSNSACPLFDSIA
jgi:hypothetical protein